MTPTVKKKREKKRFSLQEHVEWIAIAFVLALTVRCFVVEAYQIPTGSMAPALYGKHFEVTCMACEEKFSLRRDSDRPVDLSSACPSCGAPLSQVPVKVSARGGDRILVAKDLYFFKAPERWDVFVFKSPERGKENMNFVKRLVGLSGETLELMNGQVFIDGRIQSKPPAIQRHLWQNVYDHFSSSDAQEYWLTSGRWSVVEKGLLLSAGASGWQTVEYAAGIGDYYSYNGRRAQNTVGDILVSGRVTIDDDSGAFAAAVWADDNTYKAVFRPSGSTLSVELRVNEARQIERSVLIANPREFDFSLASVDSTGRITVDGEPVITVAWELTSDEAPLYTNASGVFFQGTGSSILVRDVDIKRDIYYPAHLGRPDSVNMEPFMVKVPEGDYFGLGDNSPISNDSREWGSIPRENVLGKAFFVFWPLRRIGPIP